MERLDEITIKVVLTTGDMKELCLSYRDMDYNKPETKKAMTQIVSKINSQLNINLSTQKLFIEAYPYADGGCILFVNLVNGTIPDKSGVKVFKAALEMPIIYKFKSLDSLGALTKRLCLQKCITKSSLYLCNSKSEYYLAIFSKAKLCQSATYFLNEYGAFFGKGVVAYAIINEHTKKLAATHAIEKISQCV